MIEMRESVCGTIKKICLLLPLLYLVSCTAFHPPEMPQRTGVVPGESITVSGNQNVYAVAQQYGVSMRDIIVLNGLKPPFMLKSGQSLVLPFKHDGVPGGGAGGGGGMPSDSVTAAPLGGVQTAPIDAIESRPLAPPVSVGTPSSTPVVPSVPAGDAEGHLLGQTKPSLPLNAPPVEPAKQVVTTTGGAPVAAPATVARAVEDNTSDAPSMAWPLQGAMLSGFGPKGQGVNNDGVNIGAPKGAPVVAAAGGMVVYAGNEMKGYGNLVLIRHENGWVTAYAHLDRMLVNKDTIVAQGDMIGTVGKTGNVSTPQLHFEVRHGSKVVDPNGVVKS